jgi:protease II
MFIFRTNKGAPKWRLVGINFLNPGEYYWDIVVPEDPKSVLESAKAVNK